MRIDKLLWFLRLAKSRSLAQALIGEGHIRLNGRRVEKSGTAIRVGDVLALPLPRGVTVIEVLALPERRGPASEAQTCYRVLDVGLGAALAADQNETPLGIRLP
ncbi:RNA-binding S4 domain-containing protein [Novosphingobium sp. B 225]|uniref:RNA-binding S4 domain-containing protein n=1 Tax=Novosphingobium sp. B 225 TaxID=1961849 RepID=UPI000B4B8458|nr:RNA-binding S4 domain-containing protein [Novosphingobium sp. B 225]